MRRRHPLRLLAVVVAFAAVLLAGCGAPVPAERELADALVDSGIRRDVADCTAKALVDSLPEEDLAKLAERGAGGAPVDDPNRDDDPADRFRDAITQCRALDDEAPTTIAIVPSTTAP